jgi:tRNA threonylcarbamoyladenosine biosynthesis protein TsaE
MTWQTVSTSSKSTEQLAEKLGAKLRGGEVIELISDVGGGKTTFVRGLARGMGSSEKVASPSFTIGRQYKADMLTLYHFDFYRLHEPGIMSQELAEILGDEQSVIVVEWANIVENILPNERLSIAIKATGDDTRELSFTCPQSMAYIEAREA